MPCCPAVLWCSAPFALQHWPFRRTGIKLHWVLTSCQHQSFSVLSGKTYQSASGKGSATFLYSYRKVKFKSEREEESYRSKNSANWIKMLCYIFFIKAVFREGLICLEFRIDKMKYIIAFWLFSKSDQILSILEGNMSFFTFKGVKVTFVNCDFNV